METSYITVILLVISLSLVFLRNGLNFSYYHRRKPKYVKVLSSIMFWLSIACLVSATLIALIIQTNK
jgi:hypothetical protein